MAKDAIQRLGDGTHDGESIELTGDAEVDAAEIMRLIAGAVEGDSSALADALAESSRITDALAACTDFSNIARYDTTLLAKLEFVATHFYGVKNDAIKSGPLTLSSEEFTASKGTLFRGFVSGPEIAPGKLVDAISTLRQVGQDVVGIYDASGESVAWIYYKPAECAK